MGNFEKRPVLHFSPRGGWINDPNGLTYDGKRYHLYAQHNPEDIVWGPMHWLHATSGDLLAWEEHGVALFPDDLGTAFSGSVVIDGQNTAGFGAGAMVAVYTQHGDSERQSIAYSTDGMRFTPYAGNPVIDNPGIPDFRDPKVFWNERKQCWCMALAAGAAVEFYRSANLREWSKTGAFEKAGPAQTFECPDLFMLPAPDGRMVWVLTCSLIAPPESGGGRMRYFLGEYDGQAFCAWEGYEEGLPLDEGPDDYAGATFNGAQERIYLGWAANPVYAGKVPACGYRGHMTLPRRLSLVDTTAGLRLAAEPALGVVLSEAKGAGSSLPAGAYEIQAEGGGPFELSLENRIGEAFRFGLNEQGEIFADRTRAGNSSFDGWFASPLYSVARKARVTTGTFQMRLIVDGPIVELYAERGAYVNTMLVFPKESYSEIRALGSVGLKILLYAKPHEPEK